MKPENLEILKTIVEQNINRGFVRGQKLFIESFNEDLEKKSVIDDVQLEGVMDYLLKEHINH